MANRSAMNETGIAVRCDLPGSSDVWAHTGADADAGLRIAPRPPCEADLDTQSFTRRFPVEELRAKGWRARMADHATESLSNPATAPGDRVQHDTVEYQRVSLSSFVHRGLVPKQWKRDNKQAFRTGAIAAHHLLFA